MKLKCFKKRQKQNKMDYQNGKIYRLVCNVSGKQYIGSTTQPLCKRLHMHKKHYKDWRNGRVRSNGKPVPCIRSFQILENDDFEMILIEDHPCDSKSELHRRERYYIEALDCVNKVIPTRTQKEYREQNEEYRERSKQGAIAYKEKNRQSLAEKSREYYKKNADKINHRTECGCGGKYTHQVKTRHFKTKKHQAWEQSQTKTDEP